MNTKPRPDVTRQDVENAIKQIRAGGENPTVKRIRAITGGSDATINRFKNEIEAEETLPTDSPEAVQAFRALWEKGVQAGADRLSKELGELKEDYGSTLDENERLVAQIRSAEAQVEKFQEQRDDMQSQLAKAQAEATQARANSESDARRLAEALAQLNSLREHFASEGARLRSEVSEANTKAHRMEVQAAGILAESEQLKTRLTAAEERNRHLEEQGARLESQVREENAKLAEVRTTNNEMVLKLTEAENRLADAQNRYQEEVPQLRGKLDNAIAKWHETELHLAHLKGQLELVKPKSPSNENAPKPAVRKSKSAKANNEKFVNGVPSQKVDC